jgi:hypothetical protein
MNLQIDPCLHNVQYLQMTNTFKLKNFKMFKFQNFKITMGAKIKRNHDSLLGDHLSLKYFEIFR